jgi:hypothetical protein
MLSPGSDATRHSQCMLCNSHCGKADLHKEFCVLIMLLILVTAINNGGCSTLPQDYMEPYITPFDTTSPTPGNVINAVAAILMQDERVVAAAVPDSKSVLNESRCHVYVIEDVEPQFECASFKDHGVTIAHTDAKQHPQTSDNVMITKGTSHFDLISGENWNCLKIPYVFLPLLLMILIHPYFRNKDPLEHHVATVENYIHRYSAIGSNDQAARTSLFHTFSRYLVASCWRKMYLRAIHWSSKGLMYILGSLDEKRMQQIFDASLVKTTGRRDSALAIMLQNKTLCSAVSQEYRGPNGRPDNLTEFTHLPSAFGKDKPAYNRLTCFEFHRLLVGTLLGYGKALGAFAEAMNKSDTASVAERDILAEKFYRYYRLLWRIAYSHMLIQHLEMLQAASLLRFPTDDAKEVYQDYTVFAPPKMAKEIGKEWHEAGEDKIGGEGMEGSGIVDDEMGEELRRAQMDLVVFMNAKTGRAKAFHRWIRLLTAHLGALDIISEFCHHSSQNVDISLIPVRPPPSCGTIMGDWRATVRSLASRPNGSSSVAVYNADDATKELERQIGLEHPDLTRCKIVKAFKSKPPHQAAAEFVTFNAPMHCEAALAVLASEFRENALNGSLGNLMEVCSICVQSHDVRQADCLYRNQTRR